MSHEPLSTKFSHALHGIYFSAIEDAEVLVKSIFQHEILQVNPSRVEILYEYLAKRLEANAVNFFSRTTNIIKRYPFLIADEGKWNAKAKQGEKPFLFRDDLDFHPFLQIQRFFMRRIRS